MHLYQTNNHKISIAQLAENERFSFSQKPIPSPTNHITWEDDKRDKALTKQCCIPQNSRKRRKIFQNASPQHYEHSPKPRQDSRWSNEWEVENSQLRKVKSNSNLMRNASPNIQDSHRIDSKIDEINKKLQNKRSSKHYPQRDYLARTSSSLKQQQEHQPERQQHINQLQKKLSQSTFLLNKHEEVLHKKIPFFQQKLNQNNRAITQMQTLIKTKLLQDQKNNTHLSQLAHMTNSNLRDKEQELNKINSSLLQKQIELMKNKEINKRRELELVRVKRIQDLQKNNLELYHAIQRKKCFGQFQSLVENGGQLVEGQCWDDEEGYGSKIKFSGQGDQSTIRFQTNQADVSANNTIGQILSPLALSQYQYCI